MTATATRSPTSAVSTVTPAARSRASAVGLVLLGLGAGGGIALQAYVGYQGRVTGTAPALLFWLSLSLIFGMGVAIALGLPLRRSERALAIGVISVAMQLTRIVLYPAMFVYHDELIHVRVLTDILNNHHLFTPNSSLPVTPHYAGLEIATAAVAQLTGLSAHTSGLVVLVLSRLVLCQAMFLIVERITGSNRVAAAASLIYVANPQYLFFNSQFSYQTIALPLCFGYVYLIVAMSQTRRAFAIPVFAISAVAIAASHHLTSIGLVALLVGWTAVTAATGRRPRYLVPATALAVACVAGWAFIANSSLFPYFSEIARHNVQSVQQLISGHSDHKFFKDTAGDQTPVWERYASLASVLLIVLMLPWALWAAIRHWTSRRRAAALVLCGIAAAYPLIPLGHLTEATSEVADRSSGFIFAGLAVILGWWIFGHLPGHRRVLRRPALASVAVVIGALVLFVGGTIVGSGPPWLRSPGAYLVSSENRSVDPLAIAAARWLHAEVTPDQRLYSDRINALLASAIGDAHSLSSLGDGIDNGEASRLLLAPPSPRDVNVARKDRIALLLVDTRIARDLPHVGVYTDNGEYGGANRTRPPSPTAVTKFDGIVGVDRLYDNGAIRIYSLRGLL